MAVRLSQVDENPPTHLEQDHSTCQKVVMVLPWGLKEFGMFLPE